MNRKFSLGVCISLIAIACAVTFVLTMSLSESIFNQRIAGVGEREAIYAKMQDIDSYVRLNFIGAIDEERLVTAIMNGYMAGLGDAKAGYITDSEYYEFAQNKRGRIITAGVRVSRDESGYIRIDEVFPGSSAELQGIMAGDLITQIDGIQVLEAGADDAIRRLRGEEGMRVVLILRRDGEDRRVTLIRQEIELVTVKGVSHGDLGFIRISGLADNTGNQFDTVLDEILADDVRGLVIDARGLSGYLEVPLRQILERLLPAGIAAIAEYRNGNVNTIIEIINDAHVNIPITVITDINTGSAGELLAATLRDFAGAQLVGTATRGDPVFTTTQSLRDGSAVILSIMKVRSSGGTSFDGEGIRPDFPVELVSPIETDLANLGETFDAQIRKAFEVTETRFASNA
jgi:carboxyl-terminal processing protease